MWIKSATCTIWCWNIGHFIDWQQLIVLWPCIPYSPLHAIHLIMDQTIFRDTSLDFSENDLTFHMKCLSVDDSQEIPISFLLCKAVKKDKTVVSCNFLAPFWRLIHKVLILNSENILSSFVFSRKIKLEIIFDTHKHNRLFNFKGIDKQPRLRSDWSGFFPVCYSDKHLNGVSLACRWWPNIECLLESFVFFRGFAPVLIRNPIFLWFFRWDRDPLSPPPPPPPSGSTHDFCWRPWPASYIMFMQNTLLIQVLTEPLCHAQAISYALRNKVPSCHPPSLGPALALCKNTYIDRAKRPPAFLKS